MPTLSTPDGVRACDSERTTITVRVDAVEGTDYEVVTVCYAPDDPSGLPVWVDEYLRPRKHMRLPVDAPGPERVEQYVVWPDGPS